MRLWSIHPKYLDVRGFVALWRESLLAQNVLFGKTKGYKNHPQLDRFKDHKNPKKAIGFYLYHVNKEAERRGYNFQDSKIIIPVKRIAKIKVSEKDISFEFSHLKKKLRERERKKYRELLKIRKIELHPIFKR